MQLSAGYGYGIPISIRRGATEIAGTTLDFTGTEVIDDIVVDFTTRMGEAKITVVGTAAPGELQPVLIILFPEAPALWRTGYLVYERRTLSHLPAQQGAGAGDDDSTVHMSRIPEGRYLIAAMHDVNDIGHPTDPLLFEALRQAAVPVTLVAGQTATATVTVVNLNRSSRTSIVPGAAEASLVERRLQLLQDVFAPGGTRPACQARVPGRGRSCCGAIAV